ncbi:MAG: hypothetical protein IJ733_05885, partial [Lachnospiraceae bacterium]|nr:hypothetical protein [Lachnospiraceae bacterium]
MSERIFVFPEPEEKPYTELSDSEKIERLEEQLYNVRIKDAERRAYLSARASEMRRALHAVIGYAVVAEEDM